MSNYDDGLEKFIKDLLDAASGPIVGVAEAAKLIGISRSSVRRAYNFEGLIISRAGKAKRSKVLIAVRDLGTWFWNKMSNRKG